MNGLPAQWPELEDYKSRYAIRRPRVSKEALVVIARVLNALLLPLPVLAFLFRRVPHRPDMIWSTLVFVTGTWTLVRIYRALDSARHYKYRTLKIYAFLLALGVFTNIMHLMGIA